MSLNHIVIDEDDYDDPGSFFAFDDMIGVLQPKQQNTEVHNRRGHRGESIILAGIWAPDSRITTVRYFADRDDARDAMASYVDLIDGNKYRIIQHGTDWGFFKVLTPILQAQLLPVAAAAGTIVANHTCCQVLQWTFRSTDPPPGP